LIDLYLSILPEFGFGIVILGQDFNLRSVEKLGYIPAFTLSRGKPQKTTYRIVGIHGVNYERPE